LAILTVLKQSIYIRQSTRFTKFEIDHL